MYGHWLSMAVPDIERCQWLLVIGANPVASNGSLWTVPDFRGKAKALRARGGRLTVIDPRRTETAELADAHHFIRPGSDVFLLLGMVHTLFDEGLVRLGRLAPLVEGGVDALRAAVQPYAAEVVAGRCGMPADTIRRLARELATTAQRRGVWPHRHLHPDPRHAVLVAGRRAEHPERSPRRAGRRDVPQGGRLCGQHRRAPAAGAASPRGGTAAGSAARPRCLASCRPTAWPKRSKPPGLARCVR
jgi:hypothetical protein